MYINHRCKILKRDQIRCIYIHIYNFIYTHTYMNFPGANISCGDESCGLEFTTPHEGVTIEYFSADIYIYPHVYTYIYILCKDICGYIYVYIYIRM